MYHLYKLSLNKRKIYLTYCKSESKFIKIPGLGSPFMDYIVSTNTNVAKVSQEVIGEFAIEQQCKDQILDYYSWLKDKKMILYPYMNSAKNVRCLECGSKIEDIHKDYCPHSHESNFYLLKTKFLKEIVSSGIDITNNDCLGCDYFEQPCEFALNCKHFARYKPCFNFVNADITKAKIIYGDEEYYELNGKYVGPNIQDSQ